MKFIYYSFSFPKPASYQDCTCDWLHKEYFCLILVIHRLYIEIAKIAKLKQKRSLPCEHALCKCSSKFSLLLDVGVDFKAFPGETTKIRSRVGEQHMHDATHASRERERERETLRKDLLDFPHASNFFVLFIQLRQHRIVNP